MKTVQSYLERMGSNFLVAGIIPSLAFVMVIGNLFNPILPNSLSSKLNGSINPISEPGLVSLLIAVILGFTLSSLSTFLIKVFEGYILLEHIPFLRQAELLKEKKLTRKIKYVQEDIKRLQKKGKKYEKKKLDRVDLLDNLLTKHSSSFPPNRSEILPTSFGNTLRAAEAYTSARYRIDSVPMWPRLIHVIPDSYNTKIDSSYNQLCFLVNCSVLTMGLGLLSFCASFYVFMIFLTDRYHLHLLVSLVRPGILPESYLDFIVLYMIGGFISLLVAIIFYRASLISVGEFGSMIRSSYDLFRFDLLKQLRIKLPIDSDDELDTWQDISRFFNIGRVLDDIPVFEYIHEKTDSSSARQPVQNNPGPPESLDLEQ